MRLSHNFSTNVVLGLSVLLGFYNCSIFVNGFPQWVWNPDANTAPSSGNSVGDRLVFPSSSGSTKDKVPVSIVDTQARLFPRIISAISNLRPGGSSSSSSSGGSGGASSCSSSSNVGACIGGSIAESAISNGINAGSQVAQNPSVTGVFGSILQNIFGGGVTTLPASIGSGSSDSSKDPGNGGGSSSGGSCSCVSNDACFLPNKPAGSCDGGNRINCCSSTRGTRTIFPDEADSGNSVKTVTRSEIRRALLKNIVRGSGSVIDDTLDLILHPFLTKEDQVKVATRVIADE